MASADSFLKAIRAAHFTTRPSRHDMPVYYQIFRLSVAIVHQNSDFVFFNSRSFEFLQITLPHEALRHLVQLARAYRPVTASGLLDN